MLSLLGICPKDPPEEVARKNALTKEYTYDMIQYAVPVFLASSVAYFVMKVIDFIVDTSNGDKEGLEIGLAFVVAFVMYFAGKYGSWCMAMGNEALNHVSSSDAADTMSYPIVRYLKSQNMYHPCMKFLAELSGFLFKDFLSVLVLSLVYGEHGFGPAFGLWILFIIIFMCWIWLSASVTSYLSPPLEVQEEVLEFDVDSFALGIAYTFTVLISMGSSGAGFTYIDPASVLYSYEEEDDDDREFGENQYCFLYVWICMLCVGLILLLEEKLGVHYAPKLAHSKGPVHTDSSSTAQEQRDMVANSSIELRHKVYGCFCGLAWFLLIVDNIAHLFGSTKLASLIGVLVAVAIVSWRGPSFLAAMTIRMEKHQQRVKDRQQQVADQQGGVHADPVQWWDEALLWYYKLGMHRRMVSIVAFRLALGWVWEIVVMLSFSLIAGAGASKGEKAAVALASLAVASVLSYLVLWLSKDWKPAEGVVVEGEQPMPAPAEDTVNPLARRLEEPTA